MKFFSILALVIGLITFASCTKDVGPNPDLVVAAVVDTTACTVVSYTAQIQPIFQNKCYSCHVTGTTSGAPGDFTTHAGLDGVKLKSRLIDVSGPVMPQGGPALSADQLKLIKCWLEAGAPNN